MRSNILKLLPVLKKVFVDVKGRGRCVGRIKRELGGARKECMEMGGGRLKEQREY